MMKHLVVYGILIACLVAPVHGQVPRDQTKAVIVHYTMQGDVFQVTDSRIIYGYPPNNLGQNELAVKILSRNNAVLSEFGVADPRILTYDGGARVLESVSFSITTPFYPSMASVDVYSIDAYNRTPDALLSRADLTGTVSSFCDNHREDRDCAGVSGSGPGSLLLLFLGALIVVCAGAGWYLLKKKRTG